MRAEGMKVVVTGSRYYTDKDTVRKWLSVFPIRFILHGGCRGADTLADEVGKEMGIHTMAMPAHWWMGRFAGPVRNQEMIDSGPDLVIAFPSKGSRGTYDCIRRAKKAGVPVLEIPPKEVSA